MTDPNGKNVWNWVIRRLNLTAAMIGKGLMSQRLPAKCVMELSIPNDRRRYSLLRVPSDSKYHESDGMGMTFPAGPDYLPTQPGCFFLGELAQLRHAVPTSGGSGYGLLSG